MRRPPTRRIKRGIVYLDGVPKHQRGVRQDAPQEFVFVTGLSVQLRLRRQQGASDIAHAANDAG